MNLENLVLEHTFGESPRYTLKLSKKPQPGDVVRSVFHRRNLHALVFHVLSGGREEAYSVNFHIRGEMVRPEFKYLRVRRGAQVNWERVREEKKKKMRDMAKEILPLYYNSNLGDYIPYKKGFLNLEAYINALS